MFCPRSRGLLGIPKAVPAVLFGVMFAGVPLLSSCSASNPGNDKAAVPGTVVLQDISFKPDALGLRAGESVTFDWRDGSTQHNVKFDDPTIAASPFLSKGTFVVPLAKAGTYRFHCTIHPGMKGTVTVTP